MMRSLLLFLVLGLAPLAAAQPMDPGAPPASGTLTPADGTAEVQIAVRAEVEISVPTCVGNVAPEAPDVVVDWPGGDLRVWVRAGFDATLAVHRPDGTWACDDDTEGVLPVVDLPNAPAGRYAVWLGAFGFSTGDVATLYAGAPPPPAVLDASAAPQGEIVQVTGGFEARQGAIEIPLRAGGVDAVASIDLSETLDPPAFCSGYIDAGQPTLALDYDADGGTGALGIAASSADADLVLVVQAPDGHVSCNDDAEGTHPAVGFETALSGRYTVWVGTFGPAIGPATATVSVTESAPRIDDGYGEDGGLYDDYGQPYSEGVYVPLDLDAVPSIRLQADASTAASADVTVRPQTFNPVQGPSCLGTIEAAATAAVELDGDGPFALTVRSGDDLTMTVRTPSGGWLCSDDADGFDPGVQIDAPEAGLYRVWVGTFGGLGVRATATVTAEPGELTVAGYGGAMADGPIQSGGTYQGAALQIGGAPVTLTFDTDETVTETVQAGGALLNPVTGDLCGGFVSERALGDPSSPGAPSPSRRRVQRT